MNSKQPKIIKFSGTLNQKQYEQRVSRNSCFLGIGEEQQRISQEKISNSVVGVAGSGGLGSYLAMQMARVGVRHIKIGDPDFFEESNMNRQLGAGVNSLGRNKAEVVGELISNEMPDVTVEVFPEGLQPHTAETFVDGTDLLFDCTDFFLLKERYALHQAYRKHLKTKTMLCGCIWGWGAALYEFDRDGMTYEDLIGLPDDAKLTPEATERLFLMQANYFPRFPSREEIFTWVDRVGNMPILGAIPPIGCGLLAARGILVLCDMHIEPYCKPLPPIPDYYWVDAHDLSSGIYTFDGNWINENRFQQFFKTK